MVVVVIVIVVVVMVMVTVVIVVIVVVVVVVMVVVMVVVVMVKVVVFVDGDHRGSDGLEREKRYGRGRITKNKRLTASATRCAGGRAACKCPLFSRGSARPATLACKGFGWRG